MDMACRVLPGVMTVGAGYHAGSWISLVISSFGYGDKHTKLVSVSDIVSSWLLWRYHASVYSTLQPEVYLCLYNHHT